MEKRIKKISRNMQDQTHKKINLDDKYESSRKEEGHQIQINIRVKARIISTSNDITMKL